MTTQRTDAEIARWMNTREFQHRYEEWWSQFNAGLLRDPRPPDRGEIAALIDGMADALDLPADLARGLVARKLNPEGYTAFIAKRRSQ